VITLATTLGCLLLLPSHQPRSILLSSLIPNQEAGATQDLPELSQGTAQPTPEKPEQAAPDTSKPGPTAPKKATAKASAKRSAKKRTQPKESSIVVIRNGGTLDAQGQISLSTTDQQTLEKRKNTEALLNAAITDLKQVSGKQLNPTQQDMVKQIHNYIARSKDATKTGDIQGANVLAVKAHLLSQELVKP